MKYIRKYNEDPRPAKWAYDDPSRPGIFVVLAAVFCVDEKTAIQALDRRDPILPMSPGRAERHGFEYVRNGTLSLYAAFNTRTGEVLGKTVHRHTSQEFVAFLEKLVAANKRKREIHVILDNLSAHKTRRVDEFLKENPSSPLKNSRVTSFI